MSTEVFPSELESIGLLHGLTAAELAELTLHCEVADCPPDTVIATQGNEEQTLFFLLTGEAQVVLHVPHVGEEVVAEVVAPNVVGEVSFFHAAPHTATVKCVTPARLLRLRRAKFDQLRFENNRMALKIGCNAATLLAERLQQTDAWVAAQMQSIEDRRIADTWVRFRERTSRTPLVTGAFTVA
jgi:CRP-like cAMP-binding protein